jgi:hypothetical protein
MDQALNTSRRLSSALDRLSEALRRHRWEKVDPLLRRIEQLWERLRWEAPQEKVSPQPLAERFLLVQSLFQTALRQINEQKINLRGRSRALSAYAAALATPLGTVLALSKNEEKRA